jgi:uncharacterized membrane protein YfcA
VVAATISYLAFVNINGWIDLTAPYLPTLVVALVVVVQSLFGVGVLFLGTPFLLILGLPYFEILGVLLPVSLCLSIIQTVMGWRQIQWTTVRWFVWLSLPATALGTLLLKSIVSAAHLPIAIALYLGVVSLGFYFQVAPNVIHWALKRDRLYVLLTGLIHGTTNLGGPLLSTYVLAKYDDKQQARATTAVCYGLFVVVQLLTLSMSGNPVALKSSNLLHMGIAMLVFALTNALVFHRISNQKFRMFFGCLLLLMSALLLLR